MLREAAFEASATLVGFAPHQSRSAFLLSFVAEEKDGSRANMACSHVLPTRAAIVRRPKASSLEERKRFSGLAAVLYVLAWTGRSWGSGRSQWIATLFKPMVERVLRQLVEHG